MRDDPPELPTEVIDITDLAKEMEKNGGSVPELPTNKELNKPTAASTGGIAVLGPVIAILARLLMSSGPEVTHHAVPPPQTKVPISGNARIDASGAKAGKADPSEVAAIKRCVELVAKQLGATELNDNQKQSSQIPDNGNERRKREDEQARWRSLFHQCIRDRHRLLPKAR